VARSTPLRARLARSRLARIALLPRRLARVFRHDVRVVGQSAHWLVTSREHHNYTYELTPLNREHLAWFVSQICRLPVAQARGYLAELDADTELRNHILAAIARADRRGLADRQVHYARRAGWYAFVRARKPRHVVESGVDKGLGSCVFAAALLRNADEGAPGRVTSLDINPDAGYLVRAAPWSTVVDLVIGDSIHSIGALDREVDLFLHDSDHSPGHERREFLTIETHLSDSALLLTDNVTKTRVLADLAEATGRHFLAFREEPQRHWYPGDGIGAAWR
jgi:predicted O-methyltransferase YrrM